MTSLELLVTSSVSVCVGAMIPVVLVLLQERLAARKQIVEWFEKRYIEDGIDVLHEFFSSWAILSALPARTPQELLANPTFAEVPSHAAGRLACITGHVAFQNWFNALRGQWLRAAHQGDWNQLVKFHQYVASVSEHLNELRRELLSHKVLAKRDAYRLHNLACVKRYNQVLEEMTNELQSDPSVRKYTANPRDTDETDSGGSRSI